MDWSLLACGRSGHVTFAPAEPELRDQLSATAGDGQAWRCLRCGTFVPGPPGASGPAADAPRVRRGSEVRSTFILRLFAIERFFRALIFGAAAILLWQLRNSRQSIEHAFDRKLPIVRDLFRQLGFNIDHSKLVGLINRALKLSPHTLALLALGVALYALIELVEATGLWLAKRWGEYFAMIATSLGLPLEIYDLSRKVTVTALILLGVNLLLVIYLVLTKRLFGVRGGKQAYEARLRTESVMTEAASAASRAASRHAQAAPERSATAGLTTGGPATAVPAAQAATAAADGATAQPDGSPATSPAAEDQRPG
jgi:uncharacterized membrane protein (DUF2068 family)